MEEGSSSLISSSSLLCHENQSSVNDEHQFNTITQLIVCELEYEDDYIKNLVKKEINFESNLHQSCSYDDYPSWLRDSRFDSVQWIFNAQTLLKYGNQTAYLSVSYLDHFLSIRFIDEDKLWAIRLLSVACLSLAAKMEEYKAASLSEYPVSDFGFDCHSIKKMELLILSTFQWKMSLVTPFAYLHFFTKKLGDQTVQPHDLLSKAVELVMSLIKEIRLNEYRPSVIALAAVLASYDWQMTQETLKIKVSSISLWESLDNQQELEKQILSCYSLMQRLSIKGNISTPSMTEVDHISDEIPCIVGTKRRLNFTDCDQNPNLPDKIRRD